MIPAIGLIVGFYVFTRMAQILVNAQKESPAVVVCAVITALMTLIAIAVLLMSSEQIRQALPPELRG